MQRVGARIGGARKLVAVPGRRRGVALERAASSPAIGWMRQIGLGEGRPQRAVVRRDDDRRRVVLHGRARVARQHRLLGGSGERGEAVRRQLDLAAGQALAIDAGLVGHPGREEGELGRRADIGIAGQIDDLAGDRARERLQLVVVGFEEAPFRLGVVGEGAAGRVAEAGGLALIEREILLGAQIEAEIIAVLGGDDRARLAGGERRSGQ